MRKYLVTFTATAAVESELDFKSFKKDLLSNEVELLEAKDRELVSIDRLEEYARKIFQQPSLAGGPCSRNMVWRPNSALRRRARRGRGPNKMGKVPGLRANFYPFKVQGEASFGRDT